MYKVKIFVTLKESVVDPAGAAATKEVKSKHNFQKYKTYALENILNLTLEKTDQDPNEVVDQMCREAVSQYCDRGLSF